MATTYSWGVTNSTASTATAAMQVLGVSSNYGRVEDEPTRCTLSNKTSPLDQPEVIAYKARQEKISVTTLANPPKSRDGVYYGSSVNIIRRETRDDGSVYDHPLGCTISFKHDTGHNWSDEEVLFVLARAISTLYNETDSAWRFKDLQRSALAPVED